jgi:hypothetical protein
MRRLTVVAFAAVGLAAGVGCREREQARSDAPASVEGERAREQAVEDPLVGSVAGTVARASEGHLQLRDEGGKDIVLSTDTRTRVVRDGRPVTLEALQPGSEVRASYVIQGEEWMARQVEVVPPVK